MKRVKGPYKVGTPTVVYQDNDVQEPPYSARFPGLNNYWNNLNLTFNMFGGLNPTGKINELINRDSSSSVQKVCENSSVGNLRPRRVEGNFKGHLGYEDSNNQNLEHENQDTELDPGNKDDLNKVLGIRNMGVSEDGVLNKDFWEEFLGFKEDLQEQDGAPPPINPFCNRLELSTYDKIKVTIMAIPAILKFLTSAIFFYTALIFMYIGMWGITREELMEKPLAKWRLAFKSIACRIITSSKFLFGFWRINKIGKLASQKEAPILVLGPHSSRFDAFTVPLLGAPSVLAKNDAIDLPVLGKLIEFSQSIFVDRYNPESRQWSKEEIKRRVTDGRDWPQIHIYPEGTCTNRAAMLQFRTGAFEPGVPVQPIILRYPNELDCATWTFDGPNPLWIFFLLFAQFRNHMEMEFLPVYVPNREEKADPILYAKNVQRVMANAVGVPATDMSFDDAAAVGQLLKSGVCTKLKKIWKIRGNHISLKDLPAEISFLYEQTMNSSPVWTTSFEQFQNLLEAKENKEVEELFELFNPNEDKVIDLRPYLVMFSFLYGRCKLEVLERLMFKMYVGNETIMTPDHFFDCLKSIFGTKDKDAKKVFEKGRTDRADMGFDEFQTKIHGRVEYLKFYMMEASGKISGNFPPRHTRDQRPNAK